MAYKGQVVKGTPTRSISANNGQGFTSGGKPANYSGTVNRQYEGDQSNKINPRSGTPFQSRSVNDDIEPPIQQPRNGGNPLNDADALNGVVFGVSGPSILAKAAPTMDSPVPTNAQKPIADAPSKLAAIRSGGGSAWGPNDGPTNNFQTMGGVMARGD